MKKVIVLVLITVMFIGCTTNCAQDKNLTGKYNVKDMFELIKGEKDYLYKNQLDTIYFVDSLFAYLSNYRNKLLSILKEDELLVNFDNAFLLETFFVYKVGIRKSLAKDFPYDYRAVVYFENSECKTFLDIDISKDLSKYNVDNIRVTSKRETFIHNWLSVKTEFDRQNLREGIVMAEEDHYSIISKLTKNEKFCRVLVNPFWNGFYGISPDPMTKQQVKNWKVVQDINYLTYLTGNGWAW